VDPSHARPDLEECGALQWCAGMYGENDENSEKRDALLHARCWTTHPCYLPNPEQHRNATSSLSNKTSCEPGFLSNRLAVNLVPLATDSL
jgi:hypothetical protein